MIQKTQERKNSNVTPQDYAKIGQLFQRGLKASQEYFW